MQLKEIYDIHKDKLLFDNSIYIKNLKKKLINNFNLNPKILKNNDLVNIEIDILSKYVKNYFNENNYFSFSYNS